MKQFHDLNGHIDFSKFLPVHDTLSLNLRMAKQILKVQAVEPSSLPSAVQGVHRKAGYKHGRTDIKVSGGDPAHHITAWIGKDLWPLG